MIIIKFKLKLKCQFSIILQNKKLAYILKSINKNALLSDLVVYSRRQFLRMHGIISATACVVSRTLIIRWAHGVSHWILRRCRRHHRRRGSTVRRCSCSLLRSVQVGFFLRLSNILFVPFERFGIRGNALRLVTI